MRPLGPSWPAAAGALFGLAGAGTLAFTLFTVYRLHVPLPFWDEWHSVDHFRRFAEGRYGLADLAEQHNEHRLLVPRLFFFADERLAALSGLLDATTTVLLQLVNAAVLALLACRLVARPAHRALLAGFTAILLFTLSQEQNFTNGFQLQFVGVFTAALLAGVAYAAALDRLGRGGRSAPLFALAALGCAVSAYTMTNGVLLGFVLAGIAALRRAPRGIVAATVLLSGLLAAVFFRGYVPGGDSEPLSQAVRHPLPYGRYVAAYLGNVLGPGHPRAAQALGALGLALAAGAARRVWRGAAADRASVSLASFALFVAASAAATAYGRIRLGTLQAFDTRYVTPSLLFWCALAAFWFPAAVGPARPRAAGAALGAVMALLAAAAVLGEATAWPSLAARSAELRRVSDSLISGLYDAETAGLYENTSPEDVASFVPYLREHHLSVFADPDSAALGRPLSTLGPLAAPVGCSGTVLARADAGLGEGGVRLSGTAFDAGARRAPRRIVVADAAGTVSGFGSAALPGEPSRRWTAYARGTAGAPLAAYARLADGALCRLGAADVDPPTGG